MRRLLKISIAVGLLFIFVGGVYAENPEIHCKHFIYGMPTGTPASNDLIIRDIYALSSNDKTKFADWVAYRLDPKTVSGNAQTKRKWKADPYLEDEETLEPADYTGAHAALKTDRGHQAPLASFKGTEYWEQTNFLSNITPQKSDLNQGLWVKIEGKIRVFVNAGNTVHVITGPLYEVKMPGLPGADEDHVVPSGYWKIIVFQKDKDTLLTAAFIFPQDTPRNAKVLAHLVTIDEIQQRSGLNFLWVIPDEKEVQIESRLNAEWVVEHFD